MILYFTGTGNSRYIAEKIAAALHDELLCINDRIRSEDTSPVRTGSGLVVVAPTYAWRLPHVVTEWFLKTELTGAERVWFIMDCGDSIGNAGKYNQKLCGKKALRYMGTAQVIMPENYIALFSAPGKSEAREIVRKAEPQMINAAQAIREGKAFPGQPDTLQNKLESGPVNPLFYALIVKAKQFYVKEGCVGCGKCTALCPLGNILMEKGKPVWGRSCTHCMACISYCPAEAIEYGRKSVGKERYYFEKIKADL